MLDCKEVANRFDVEVHTVYRWIKSKKLKAHKKVGKLGYFVNEEDLAEFVKKYEQVGN